jgi:hypothetical protein
MDDKFFIQPIRNTKTKYITRFHFNLVEMGSMRRLNFAS